MIVEKKTKSCFFLQRYGNRSEKILFLKMGNIKTFMSKYSHVDTTIDI